MPHYFRSDEFFGVTYITGPSHIALELAFGPQPDAEPLLIELPCAASAPERTVDPQQIRSAVLDASRATNAELGTSFFPSAIRYVADDSPRYSLYAYCATLLIRRVVSGDHFEQPT
jgi:hypothetical protein